MNILIAYTDKPNRLFFFLFSSLFTDFVFSEPSIDPDMSRHKIAFNGTSFLYAPSLSLFKKIARKSLILLSEMLFSNWYLAYPKWQSISLFVLGPTSNFN